MTISIVTVLRIISGTVKWFLLAMPSSVCPPFSSQNPETNLRVHLRIDGFEAHFQTHFQSPFFKHIVTLYDMIE